MHTNTKAAKIWQLTFSVSLLFLFFGCEEPGTIGGEFVDPIEIAIDTLFVTDLTTETIDPYLGKLTLSAVGSFNDSEFGQATAFSFVKPEISRISEDDTLRSTFNFFLNLNMDFNDAFGDTSTDNSYSIYRVINPWRGSTFRKSETITYSTAEVIGSFDDSMIDSLGFVETRLTGTWKDDYIRIFNLPDSIREDEYRETDFGLAIVHNGVSNKISVINNTQSQLTVIGADTTYQSFLDWGYDIDQAIPSSSGSTVALPSTYDNFLSFNLAELADQVSSQDFIRAELVFNEDTLALSSSLSDSEIRSSYLGLALINDQVDDLGYQFVIGAFNANAVNEDGAFVFNMTTLINNYFFSDTSLDKVYVYLFSNQGALSYTSLFNESSSPDLAPKLIIYSAN
ncbi:MAG: hypothetical protein ED557_09190 [Balneola sp.]|nr:MAG: hypothetical protein ED557_09190 [Balneola sp.]